MALAFLFAVIWVSMIVQLVPEVIPHPGRIPDLLFPIFYSFPPTSVRIVVVFVGHRFHVLTFL